MPGLLAASDFDQWREQQRQSYEEFLTQQDEQFLEYVETQWETFNARKGESHLIDPKIESAPTAASGDAVSPPSQLSLTDSSQHQHSESLPSQSGQTATDNEALSVSFHRHTLRLPDTPQLRAVGDSVSVTQQHIADFWREMRKNTTDGELIAALDEASEALDLNDWGRGRLFLKTGLALFNEDPNAARLFSWFMLMQSGYDARVGMADNAIQLLLPVEQTLYATRYFNIDQRRYYAVNMKGEPDAPDRMTTYDGKHSDSERVFTTRVPGLPLADFQTITRRLEFDYEGETHEFEIPLNPARIEFFKYYPQTDIPIYLEAPVAPATAEALLGQLSPLLRGRNERDRIDLLLQFSQKAFGYRIDPENFGREKPLFPEETLFYSHSDCEDRAILFTWLVRELTDQEVLVLRYPGHIAAAVDLPPEPGDDQVPTGTHRYIITDPTYIGANPGMAMPQFQGKTPEIEWSTRSL